MEKSAHRETSTRWSTDVGRCMFPISFWDPATVADWCDVGRVTIDMLPDVALLEIFECYVNQAREEEDPYDPYERWLTIQTWHTLVHVCRKWRRIVLGSPGRLDLRLFCKDTTPVKETLAVWPPLPIVIGQHNQPEQSMDNIIAALERNDRVCEIRLKFATKLELEEVLAAMQQRFPALTHLEMWLPELEDETLVVPGSFLGGSAPRLQYLQFDHIPFPGLPKLILSATGLVDLHLIDIPHSGYISPEAMARCLSTLTSLEELTLQFKSPLSRPLRESQRSHSPTRSVLLALTEFWFQGVSEYLEDLVARIDAPLLDTFDIRFFHQLIFDTPKLTQFIARTPNTQPPVEARIAFSDRDVVVTCPGTFARSFSLGISCRQSDWRLSSLAQVCSLSFPEAFIPGVEVLYIYEHEYFQPRWQDDIEDSQWLEALHLFTAVKYLYLSQELASRIAPALQELASEVLPSLQNIFLEDLHPSVPVQGAIGKFVAARQLAGHHIAVSLGWKTRQMVGAR